jgi:FKBP-type peptidyl-prolyl cis-trans isomerase FkpA
MKKLFVLLFLTLFFTGGRAMAQGVSSDSAFTGSGSDFIIQQYCKAHKIVASKTASGLYYVIKKVGKGPAVTDSQKVSVNYTGSLINGFIFDSNTRKKFHHKAPFQYTVGAGQLIKGFDEGDKLLRVGGSAILIIPPTLGYGDKDLKIIPPNSILIFEVQILSVNKS